MLGGAASTPGEAAPEGAAMARAGDAGPQSALGAKSDAALAGQAANPQPAEFPAQSATPSAEKPTPAKSADIVAAPQPQIPQSAAPPAASDRLAAPALAAKPSGEPPAPMRSEKSRPQAAPEIAARAPLSSSKQSRRADFNQSLAAASSESSAPDAKSRAPAAPTFARDNQELAPRAPAPTLAALQLTTSGEAGASYAHKPAPAAAALHQVSREIVRRFSGESTRFELRLDPPELGRVEVRLEVTRDHRVTAIVAADNPQALAELVRHARELEQALQSSGLDLAEDGLSFDLSERRQHAPGGAGEPNADGQSPTEEQTQTRAGPVRLESWQGQRIDLVA